MSRMSICRFGLVAVLGLAVSLSLAGSAYALFPPPFYFPTGVSAGEVPEPPPPPPTPPPENPPPCECCCNCQTHVSSTPEPATMISALVGAALLGGFGFYRRKK